MVIMDSKKLESILIFLIGIVLVVIVNQLSSYYFFRIDLTEEKRFTISEATIEILENLDEVVYIDVYLEGDFPAPFKRLQRSIRETLEEFKVYAGENLDYRFVNPAQAVGNKARSEFYQSLARKGIQPTNLFDSDDGKQTQNLIFPGAIVSYGMEETGVMLLKGNKSSGPQEQLNQSIEGIEYRLAKAIKKLSEPRSKRIALIKGHGELDTLSTASLSSALLDQYKVYHVDLTRRRDLTGYDLIIMAKPRDAFGEADKYKIDQYIMRGGNAMFFIDKLRVNMDSASGEGTLAVPIELNLDDLFFKYGFRFNNDYVLDLNSGRYPVVVGNVGENPQVMLMQWPFFPLINNYTDHPIVRNLDAAYAKFVGTIDTVKASGILRTPLMRTSNYSKVFEAPVRVSVNELRKEIKPEMFNSGPRAIAWIAEGAFTSVFNNRILPTGVDVNDFLSQGEPAKIMVVSDGDLVRNDINPQTGQPVELGFDQFTRTNYANLDFVSNAVTYMLEETGLIQTRSKEIRIRPLDKVKIEDQRLTWQLVNLIVPIFLLAIFGIVKHITRKRKYSQKRP